MRSFDLERTSTLFHRALLCALAAGACVPPEGAPDTATDPQTTAGDDSGEPLPEPTSGASTSGDETTDAPTTDATTTDATTGEPAEVDPCGVDDPLLFRPQPYAAIAKEVDEDCALTGFGAVDGAPGALALDFACGGAGPTSLQLLGGPMPDWAPLVGATLRVTIQREVGGPTGRDQETVTLLRDFQLIYASVRMDDLIIPGPHKTKPVYLVATVGTCEGRSTANNPGAPDDADAFWCAQARREQLWTYVSGAEGEEVAFLASGQSITVPDPLFGGAYEIDARTIVAGRGCVGLPADQEVYTVAYAVAFHAD